MARETVAPAASSWICECRHQYYTHEGSGGRCQYALPRAGLRSGMYFVRGTAIFPQVPAGRLEDSYLIPDVGDRRFFPLEVRCLCTGFKPAVAP